MLHRYIRREAMENNFGFDSIDSSYLDALKEIGNIGAGNATTAISNMLNLKVNMEVPKVEFLTFQELPTATSAEEETVVGIYLEVESDIGGRNHNGGRLYGGGRRHQRKHDVSFGKGVLEASGESDDGRVR